MSRFNPVLRPSYLVACKLAQNRGGQVCGLAALAGLNCPVGALGGGPGPCMHGLGTGLAAGPPQAPLHQAQEARTAHARVPGPVEPLERGLWVL